jgi:electron transfer flavoprotein alpha subunit
VLSSAIKPRYMTVKGIMEAYDKEVEVWGADKLDVEVERLGLSGSPTRVKKSFTKPQKQPGEVFEVDAEEAVEIIVKKLKEKHIIEPRIYKTMEKTDYKNIHVFVEQRDGVIQSVALELLGKAHELSADLHEKVVAVLAGYQIKDQAQMLIEYGADEVICMDAPELKDYLTEQYTQAIYQVVMEFKPSIMLIGASTIGRDLAPRLACRLNTGLTADCTKLEITEDMQLASTRPAFGGNLMATILNTEHRPQMSTVRPGVMQKMARDNSRKGEIIDFKPTFDSSKFKVRLVKNVKEDKGTVDITDAKILISGGRGVANKAGFDKLQALADVLPGAEVSSSRAMVDAGIIDHSRQVGQTGKTVRPNLYMACGISGAIQHLAGMEESELIIAINKDKFAPIFSVADLGIVCDLNKVVPLLTARLAKEIEK